MKNCRNFSWISVDELWLTEKKKKEDYGVITQQNEGQVNFEGSFTIHDLHLSE